MTRITVFPSSLRMGFKIDNYRRRDYIHFIYTNLEAYCCLGGIL